MMELKLFVTAEYAATTRDNRLVIAGIFDWFPVTRPRGMSQAAAGTLVLPAFYLALRVHASLIDGTVHEAAIRVVDGSGQIVMPLAPVAQLHFGIRPQARPTVAEGVVRVPTFMVPGPGEYSFELWINGQRLGETTLYVVDVTPP